MKRRYYVNILAIALFPIFARANAENFAHCALMYSQQDAAKGEMPDHARLAEMDSLIGDVYSLSKKLKTRISSDTSFTLKKCLDHKKQTLAVHIQRVSDQERSKARYNKLLGKLNTILERHSEALRYYKTAAKYDSQDYDAFFQALNSWFFVTSERIAVAKSQLSLKDTQDMVRESDEFILPIWNNPSAPNPYKIKVMQMRAKLLESRGREAEASQDWRKISSLDPTNVEALLKVADFEFTRGRPQDAYLFYNKLHALQPNNNHVLERLIELGLQNGDLGTALSNTKKAYEQNPKDARVAAIHAKALLLNSRPDEARKINAEALKRDPSNLLAKNTQGLILEVEGDTSHREKLYSKALYQYSEALKLLPEKVHLRVKMAALLYDFRKSQNFEPLDVSQKDMDEAVRLIAPALNEPVITEETALLHILSAGRSSNPKAALVGCKRYEKDYGLMPALESLKCCISAYQLSGDIKNARRLVESALSDSRYHGSTRELTQTMSRL